MPEKLRILTIEPTVFFVRDGEALRQQVRVTVDNPGEAVAASLTVRSENIDVSLTLDRRVCCQHVLRHLQGALLQSLAVDFLDDVVIDPRIGEPLFETIDPQAAVLEVRQADDEDLRVDAVLAGVGTGR